jgi:hypothetical protein
VAASRTLRNILVVGGAYLFSTWLVTPLWLFVITPWMNRDGGHGFWLTTSVGWIPAVVGCGLAGIGAGLAIESEKPIAWALIFGALVIVVRWLGWTWHLPPDLEDRARQALDAIVPAAAAAAGVLIARRNVHAQDRSTRVGA